MDPIKIAIDPELPESPSLPSLAREGLWRQNPALVGLLGLCPLLAVSTNVVNALAMGLATTCVLIGSNVLIALGAPFIQKGSRLPFYVLLIAGMVSIAEILVGVVAYPLRQPLGLFLPLITTNCVILARAEAFASRYRPMTAAADGLFMGLGFSLVLFLLGSIREISASGTWFAQAETLLGVLGNRFSVSLSHDETGFLLAALPPGAFILLGCLVALKNAIMAADQSRDGEAPIS